MKIQRTNKLPIFNLIDRNSSILIANIDSFLSGFDNPDIDITLIFIEIFDRLASFECNDSNVLIDTSYDKFFLFIRKRWYLMGGQQSCIAWRWVERWFVRIRMSSRPSPFYNVSLLFIISIYHYNLNSVNLVNVIKNKKYQ